jgi:hypothetical protein
VEWTASFTGKIKVKISEFPCKANQLQTKLAFKSNIDPPTCDITLVAEPTESASVIGGGQFNFGQQVIVKTLPNSGWNFLGWFDNNTLVHAAYTYVFIADVSKILTAKYIFGNDIQNNINDFNIYFNSSSTSIDFIGEFKNKSTIHIYDVTGRLIESSQIQKDFSTWSIPIAHLNNGIYIIEVMNNQQIIRKKIRIIK